MKKLLTTMFCVSMLTCAIQTANAVPAASYQQTAKNTIDRMQPPEFEQFDKQNHPIFKLEDELKLNDEQKAKAKANRIKGRKEMKPIMDQIRTKREEILDILDSDLTQEQQQEKIRPIQKELKVLHQKANELRKKNMEEFEKILSKSQKAKFEELKKQHPATGCKHCDRKAPLPPMPHED